MKCRRFIESLFGLCVDRLLYLVTFNLNSTEIWVASKFLHIKFNLTLIQSVSLKAAVMCSILPFLLYFKATANPSQPFTVLCTGVYRLAAWGSAFLASSHYFVTLCFAFSKYLPSSESVQHKKGLQYWLRLLIFISGNSQYSRVNSIKGI